MPRNLSETDRKKNQFDKEERVHLLSIMKQYAPLLDKSASTLARKKIWTVIENEFKRAGFTRKTSAQLKKYWQNYKYHCKKAKALGKETRNCAKSEKDESSEWNRYQVFVENRSANKYLEIPDVLRPLMDEPRSSPIETFNNNGESPGKLNSLDSFIDLSQIKTEKIDVETELDDHEERETNPSEDVNPDGDSLDERKEIFLNEDRLASSPTDTTDHKTRNRIVVSNANISNNSVTVSVIYPENEGDCSANATDRTHEVRSRTVPVATRKPGNEEYDSLECTDSTLGKCSAGNRPTAPAENQENDTAPGSRSSETRNEHSTSKGYVFLTDYRNQLKHRLLLQRLETEEKRLKVKIAEMAIQEVQLRIKALHEDMRRTEELHRLRLARVVTGDGHF
ncbi:uncharacterized protein LOC143342853 [Colletes latitarsis]|uniref:uncharacterized protein LOC143342853 n=1 Tax=Colletes latitarsis TaxID=2605962 RepID=UPI0040370CE4